MTFAQILQSARQDKDITQQEMADKIGVTRRQYIRYEKGEQEMSFQKLREICLYLNISADYFLNLPNNLEWPRRKMK